jgi:hypothetical protein
MKDVRAQTIHRPGLVVSLGFSFIGLALAGFTAAGCSSADPQGTTSAALRVPGSQCVFVGEPPLPTCELVADTCATVLCATGTRCENGDCIPVDEPVIRANDLGLWACGDKLCADRQLCAMVVGGLPESPPSSSCGDLPPGCVDCSCIDVGPPCVCEASAGHVTVTCFAP